MFKFKQFQVEDYVRAAMHDGVILAHDTGGGKSLARVTWPALKVGFQGDGQSGSDFVRENFAVEKMVDGIYNLYLKLAADRGLRP